MSECGYGKRVHFSEFMPHGRGTGGQKIYTTDEKTGELVGLLTVCDTEEVVCITSQGKTIRVKADTISTMGRAAQGVRILNINKPDILIGIDTVANEDDEEKPLGLEGDSVTSISEELDLDGSDQPISQLNDDDLNDEDSEDNNQLDDSDDIDTIEDQDDE